MKQKFETLRSRCVPLPLSVAEKRNFSFVEPPDAIVFPFSNENVPEGATVSR